MSLDKIELLWTKQLQLKDKQGIAKRNESVITGIRATTDGYGPRYYLAGHTDSAFLRMNSNSYLGLENHKKLIAAEAKAVDQFGTGSGAVRFISGSYQAHIDLEQKLAEFHGRESAMLFNAAYATMIGVLPQFITDDTLVISDALNHNCIINAMRLSKPAKKAIYKHLDMAELNQILQASKSQFKRACVVTDGVFSMRGDYARLDQIIALCQQHEAGYEQGIISLVDDSHGVGVWGQTGRGTEEITRTNADVLIATLGKAFAVNGGYVVSNRKIVDYLKETSPLYIFSNPITPAEAAAALKAVQIVDSEEGINKLKKLNKLSQQLRNGLTNLGFETLQSDHPIVPVFIRDTDKTGLLVKYLFAHKILATGLNFPVVPKGEEEIRLQVSASHTTKDIDYLLTVLSGFCDESNA
ncbi:MAG: aminotransferase class I/II-fold pyridoxal phosphate-dependent enzyme [Methylococcales symbiont of Hymedesmia sp. n. MRB-2018]|nr:MAG: aminotransferase class I/II-fold pyridoxal phosphate-dependent enzyme [Methylococcales symbiont of Hymedesmia sp. n. MRB-2018]KAF3984683.1 MAG: aminotransferase class I/II-fold pyridoxal phosphate-dependent enzyme [Methylococcales symbiont of Hymedesmia sp. n. MRB-2018]